MTLRQAYNDQVRRRGQNATLLNIEWGANETLWEFIRRFATAIHSINNSLDEVTMLALQPRLNTSNYISSLISKRACKYIVGGQ